jgi:cystathionine gamma-synthase
LTQTPTPPPLRLAYDAPMDPKSVHPDTVAAQALGWIDEHTRAVAPPIHVSSTYLRDADNQYRSGRIYARADNPAFDQPEAVLAALEGGTQALLFASGMAAATACFLALAPGDRVLAPKVMYWSLRNWLTTFAVDWGLQVELVDMDDLGALAAALERAPARLVWVETPANPLWTVTDIAAAARLAHAAGALLTVDSTVATPVLTRPLDLGADVVMHAATKYLNGHSDLIAGALVVREQAGAPGDYWQRVRKVRAQVGGTLGSFEAWLLLRGMRTLPLRVRAACAAAQRIAEHFSGHRHVRAVRYPGLPAAPGHAVAAAQMRGGFGGMLSICTAGGEAAAIAVAAHTRLWKRATSLGGTESLIEHRASVEGPGTPAPADLLRLSAGTEHVDDLIADLEQALQRAHA